MTITAFDSPVGGGIPAAPLSGMPANTNPEAGPSFFNHGLMLLDPRGPVTYIPGQNFGKQVSGWFSMRCEAINQVPSVLTANNIVAAQTATANTALTLVSSNTTGITVSTSITRMDTGATVTGLLAIDSAMTTVSFGTAGTIRPWSPATAIARNVRITSNGADQTGTFTVVGFDLYGNPMAEVIAGTAGTVTTTSIASGVKAFKYIQSITPAGTVNSTGLTVGTGDVIGLPLRADYVGYVDINFNSTAVTVGTGFTAAVTSTATSTSGDVRGTYALQLASDGTRRLTVFISPAVANAGSTTGLLGVTQYST